MSIIDTPASTENKALSLISQGVRTVIRYYNFSNSRSFPNKCLTLAEAEALSVVGLHIGVVFQQKQNSPEDFNKARGIAAGTRAFRYAHDNIGQPLGSGIYFSVDFDATDKQIATAIIPFFEGIRQAFTDECHGGDKYRVGVYGSGLVSSTLRTHQLIDLTWLAMSRKFKGTHEALAKGEYHLAQQPGEAKLLGLDVDFNTSNPDQPAYADFGSFTVSSTSLPANATEPEPTPAPQAQPYRVLARKGLNLRSGPSIEFAIIGSLAMNQTVYVVSITQDWARVDLEGDGQVDGFVSAHFIEWA